MSAPTERPPVTVGVAQDVGRFLGLSTDDNLATADHAARVVFALLTGQLRGKVPDPWPKDLDGVLRSATTRYAVGLLKLVRGQPEDKDAPDYPAFMGFLLHERIVINRYRRTTA